MTGLKAVTQVGDQWSRRSIQVGNQCRRCRIKGCRRPRLRQQRSRRSKASRVSRLFLTGAIIFGVAWAALGSPFLVCDPYPAGLDQASRPTSFVLTGLAQNPISTPATVNADGTVQLHYDLATLGNGNYTVTASAVNALGGISPASLPFGFIRGVPSVPTNLRLVP